jgi:hypothetical protein
MPKILQAGNGQSQNHRATIALNPNLNLPQGPPPGNYMFLACAARALAGPMGVHINGFSMGGAGNKFITDFEVWTDEAISQFSWIVVK